MLACPTCRYDLSGVRGSTCPECSARFRLVAETAGHVLVTDGQARAAAVLAAVAVLALWASIVLARAVVMHGLDQELSLLNAQTALLTFHNKLIIAAGGGPAVGAQQAPTPPGVAPPGAAGVVRAAASSPLLCVLCVAAAAMVLLAWFPAGRACRTPERARRFRTSALVLYGAAVGLCALALASTFAHLL